jgi:hypothetical protein
MKEDEMRLIARWIVEALKNLEKPRRSRASAPAWPNSPRASRSTNPSLEAPPPRARPGRGIHA